MNGSGSRTWLGVAGILAIIAGMISIAVPALGSVAMDLLIGWILIFVGIVVLATCLVQPRTFWTVAGRVIWAGLALFVGVWLIVRPIQGTVGLTLILTIWLIASGIIRIFFGARFHGAQGSGWTIFSGIVSVLLGILIAVDLPTSAAWAIGLLIGIDLLFFGVTAILAAWFPTAGAGGDSQRPSVAT